MINHGVSRKLSRNSDKDEYFPGQIGSVNLLLL